MKYWIISVLVGLTVSTAMGQNQNGPGKVNLDDIKIKGEANGSGLGFSNRSRYNLDNRLKIREDFRPEVMENLPHYFKTQQENVNHLKNRNHF